MADALADAMSIQPHLHNPPCNPALYDSNDLECKDSLWQITCVVELHSICMCLPHV